MKKLVSLLLCLSLLLALALPAAVAEEATLEPKTLTMLVPENDPAGLPFQLADIVSGKIENQVWDVFQSWLDAKNLTIEFELIANAQYDVVAQTRLASSLDLPDVMNTRASAFSDSQIMSYANLGLLLPVSDIIKEQCLQETRDYIDEKYPFYYGATVNPADGKSYTYGQLDAYTIDGEFNSFTQPAHIRYDWLQKCNLEAPTTVWELLDAVKVFHEQDANGNGVIGDECYSMSDYFQAFGGSFGLTPLLLTGMVNDGNNQIVSPWLQEHAKDYFAFMQQMYAEGALDPAVMTQLNAENRLCGDTNGYAYVDTFDIACPDPDCFYLPLQQLTAIEGVTPVAVMDPTQLYLTAICFAVTSACQDTEPVARLLDILFTPEYEELTMAGIRDVTYTLLEGNGDFPVMNTNIDFIVSDGDVEQMRATGLCKGYRLWGKGIFPRIITVNVLSSFIEQKIAAYEEAGDWQNVLRYQNQLESYSYPLRAYRMESYLAMPTDEEAERKEELTTDLTTYASELFTNLVTGAASLDNWDSYISDLRAMGLDELIQIDQTLADRKANA